MRKQNIVMPDTTDPRFTPSVAVAKAMVERYTAELFSLVHRWKVPADDLPRMKELRLASRAWLELSKPKAQKLARGAFSVVAAVVASTVLSGCAGMQLSGTLGATRIDEQSTVTRTYREDTKPIACLWSDCSAKPARAEEVVHGS